MTENPAQYGTIYSGRGPKGLSFFPGCTAHYLFPRIGEACDVVAAPVAGGLRVPQGLSCCGLAALSAGDMDEARRCARINIEALEPGSGPVLVSCASCYVHLLRYPTLFDDDPVWRGRAERLAARLLELSCFLDHHLPREKEAPSVEKNLRVFYHHPCHLRFGVQIMEEPRRLLGRHPGIQLLELADGPECCGQGGLFHIGSPEIAAAIRDSLATKVLAMNPDVITTSCSGCLLQWRMAMAAADSPVRVLHLAETLRLVKTE
jgi:glycolate oxidase iron-sulfur subunit